MKLADDDIDFDRLADLRRRLAAPAWDAKLAELAAADDARPADAPPVSATAAVPVEPSDSQPAPIDAATGQPGGSVALPIPGPIPTGPIPPAAEGAPCPAEGVVPAVPPIAPPVAPITVHDLMC